MLFQPFLEDHLGYMKETVLGETNLSVHGGKIPVSSQFHTSQVESPIHQVHLSFIPLSPSCHARPRHVSSTVGEPLMVTSLKFNIYIRQETFETFMHFVLRHSSLGLHLCPFGTTKRSNATTLVMNLVRDWQKSTSLVWMEGDFWDFVCFSTKDHPPNYPTQGQGTPPNTFVDVLPNGFVSQGLSAGRGGIDLRKLGEHVIYSIELHLSQGLEVRLEWCFGCCFWWPSIMGFLVPLGFLGW